MPIIPSHIRRKYEVAVQHLWHLEIIPRLTTPAGFELGSGILVNPCVPEEAAEFLRDT